MHDRVPTRLDYMRIKYSFDIYYILKVHDRATRKKINARKSHKKA